MAASTMPHTLLLKKLHKQPQHLMHEFDSLQPRPVQIKCFGRRRVLLTFDSAAAATTMELALRQTQKFGAQLQVTHFIATSPRKTCVLAKLHKMTQTPIVNATAMPPIINKFVQKLYASAPQLNFEQPPPPYLKYAYPRITPDILDAISIALLSNSRFYTQVLHLMNRMNLEPPFVPGSHKFGASAAVQSNKHVATQTDTCAELCIETELESSSDEETAKRIHKQNSALNVKRKLPPSDEQFRKKARQLLQSTMLRQNLAKPAVAVAVAAATAKPKAAKIMLNLQPAMPATLQIGNMQRLSIAELSALPAYQNYQRGEASQKLYIKNLSKTVTADDLLQLYAHFASPEQLQIKLMQQGRMKGQAFVSFENVQPATRLAELMEQALNETNGLLLHDKPMLVCYGKK